MKKMTKKTTSDPKKKSEAKSNATVQLKPKLSRPRSRQPEPNLKLKSLPLSEYGVAGNAAPLALPNPNYRMVLTPHCARRTETAK
jgi:hypothetical protein